MAAQQILPPGTQLGRYRIAHAIGVGGMGTVYEAVHTDLDKRVAVKVLHDDAAVDPVSRARFLQEGQTAAKIHHPHVVEVFDVGQTDGRLYLVMEHLEGNSLGDLFDERGRVGVTELVDLMLPVCAALVSAHELGVVHRDLKPDNIFLARSRHGAMQPKLLDFGISKHTKKRGRALTIDHTLGTPEYMSPEQVSDTAGVDARADQYALGVVLYEGSTGRRPFEGADVYALLEAVQSGRFEPPSAVLPTIPSDFEAVVVRAMSRDPSARFADMLSLSLALLPFASESVRATWSPVFGRPPVDARRAQPSAAPLDAPTVTLPDPTQPDISPRAPSRRRWPWVALAGVVAVALAAGAFRALDSSPEPPPPPSPLEAVPVARGPEVPPMVAPAAVAPPTAAPAQLTRPRPAHLRRGGSSSRPPRGIVVDHGSNRAPIVE